MASPIDYDGAVRGSSWTESDTAANEPEQSAADDRVTQVVIDAHVAVDIVKHCSEGLPEIVTGQLLGLDVDGTLEVTHAFPFADEENATGGDSAEYQLEMMKCLREVNADNNTVGWYTSTFLGSFLHQSMIETQFNYQDTIKTGVGLIFDPIRTAEGALCIRAVRFTKDFMQLYEKGSFAPADLNSKNVFASNIFEEIPVRIRSSKLTDVLLCTLAEGMPMEEVESDTRAFDLDFNPFLEKNLQFLNECMDELQSENHKYAQYERQVHRQRMDRNAFLQRRRAENNARKQAGQPPLPEEDLSRHPLFRTIRPPSRLEPLLISNQIQRYCDQINDYAGQGIAKMYLTAETQTRTGQ